MAIEIRPTSGAASFSTGDFTNPLCFTFNGSMGGTHEKELYLVNTDSVNSFIVEIQTDPAPGDPAPPYEVYLKSSGGDWVQGHLPMSLGTVAVNQTVPFFIRIKMDPDVEITNFTDLKIKVTETAVP